MAFVGAFQTALQRSFTSTNLVRDVADREISASTARLSWAARVGEEEELGALAQEADDLASDWWDTARRHPERVLREALTRARVSGAPSVLWFRLAPIALRADERGVLTVNPALDEAALLRYLRLELLPVGSARVWEDPDTLSPRACYAYTIDRRECAHTAWVDEAGLTHLRHYTYAENGDAVTEEITLDLGGRLPYISLELPALISPQVSQNQMAYNTASTMMLRNTELAGFVERFGIGIEPPSEMVPDPSDPTRYVKRYLPVKVGGGNMNLWAAQTVATQEVVNGQVVNTERPAGNQQYGRLEPVSAEPLQAAATHHLQNIYQETGQMYVLMSADSTSSGRSREVAMADGEARREPVIDTGKNAISEILHTLTAMLAALRGQAGRWADVVFEGQVRSRVIPPSAQDRQQDREDVAAGILDVDTVRLRQGEDDPEGIQARIDAEREKTARLQAAQLSAAERANTPSGTVNVVS